MEALHLGIVGLLAVINFPFVIAVDRYMRVRPAKRVFALEADRQQIRREVVNALVTTPVHAALLLLVLATGALRPGPDTPLLVAAGFALTFVWTEIWHYFSHVAMHQKSLLFIHREHHKSKITNPWTSVSFSLLEKFIFSAGILGFMAALSHWMPVSVLGIGLYYTLYFFTNTLGHANIEFRKPDYSRTWMAKCLNAPSYHVLHHARYVKNYGLLTPFLDRLFGTAWEDHAEVQRQAALGVPLRKLSERCVTSSSQSSP